MFKRQRSSLLAAARSRRKPGKQGGGGWAAVGAALTFRAELMPGRERERRTFIVARVLASGRVELRGLLGEHAEMEFEPLR